MRRSVVITGIGAITAAGIGAGGLWSGIVAGKSRVRRITRFDPTPFRSQVAAEVDSFEAERFLAPKASRRMDRFSQFAVVCSRQALLDSGLCLERVDRSRIGVALGSALGGVAYGEQQHAAYLSEGMKAVGPTLAIAVYGGAAGSNIAIELGLRGPNRAHASSCAAGANAIGDALKAIRHGDADVMLAGGIEAPLAPLTFGAFSLIKAMSSRNGSPEESCRPFDRDRDGFVMGEGAAVLVLEEEGRARRRDARIYARLEGYGETTDAHHMTAPLPDGSEASRAMRLALGDAGVDPSEVGYVNAHATGTPLGDAAETNALKSVFGGNGSGPWISGTKAIYGHALGASGAIELAITALALFNRFLPGNANLTQADAGPQIRLLRLPGLPARIDHALSTSFGFGGANAALLVKLFEG